MDDALDVLQLRPGQIARGGVCLPEQRGDLVHGGVGALGRKHHRAGQVEGVVVIERAGALAVMVEHALLDERRALTLGGHGLAGHGRLLPAVRSGVPSGG